MDVKLLKQEIEKQKVLGIGLITSEAMDLVFEELERLQKENLQLKCYKAAYEKTYHQLLETEGKLKCSLEPK